MVITKCHDRQMTRRTNPAPCYRMKLGGSEDTESQVADGCRVKVLCRDDASLTKRSLAEMVNVEMADAELCGSLS